MWELEGETDGAEDLVDGYEYGEIDDESEEEEGDGDTDESEILAEWLEDTGDSDPAAMDGYIDDVL